MCSSGSAAVLIAPTEPRVGSTGFYITCIQVVHDVHFYTSCQSEEATDVPCLLSSHTAHSKTHRLASVESANECLWTLDISDVLRRAHSWSEPFFSSAGSGCAHVFTHSHTQPCSWCARLELHGNICTFSTRNLLLAQLC